MLNDAGVKVIIITNQRGIALGKMSEADLSAVHQRLAELLDSEGGAFVDAVLFCPHERNVCDCRKPAPGLLLEAKARWPSIELAQSVTIGDRQTDVDAGRAAGTHTVLLREDAVDLKTAVEMTLCPR
jgi:D-glycero-D-manno-heptose 1,7-bisphosphate phosphatase